MINRKDNSVKEKDNVINSGWIENEEDNIY